MASIDDRLDELNNNLERMLDELQKGKKIQEKHKLMMFGLREHEAEAWLENEPNYDRPIIRRKFTGEETRRRLNRACMQVLLT